MSLLGYWMCANGVQHKGECNCVIRPPKWITWRWS